MAPERPPQLVVMDLRIEDGKLKGILEYIEAPENQLLRVRWAIGDQPENYFPVGNGVAYVYQTPETFVIPISRDAAPESLGDSRYRMQEGLSQGQPWLMLILILPEGYTLSNPQPAPVSAKEFRGRLALYWILEGDKFGRTRVDWTLDKLSNELTHEVEKINRSYSSDYVPTEANLQLVHKQNVSNLIFISYSHKDTRWLHRLQVHLKPLERRGSIERWDDTLIQPGTKWQDEIKKALVSAKVAVLLVSADFLASDFIAHNELPPLLEAAEAKGVIILPVIVSPCLFNETEGLSRFQSVNSPSQPLSNMPRGRQEQVLLNVSTAIGRILNT